MPVRRIGQVFDPDRQPVHEQRRRQSVRAVDFEHARRVGDIAGLVERLAPVRNVAVGASVDRPDAADEVIRVVVVDVQPEAGRRMAVVKCERGSFFWEPCSR